MNLGAWYSLKIGMMLPYLMINIVHASFPASMECHPLFLSAADQVVLQLHLQRLDFLLEHRDPRLQRRGDIVLDLAQEPDLPPDDEFLDVLVVHTPFPSRA